jgi:hypothetical protein
MVTVGTAEPLAVAVVGAIRSGDPSSRQRVALLMRTHGLVGCHRRRAAVAHPPIPDVIRRAHRRRAHRRLMCEYRQAA